MAETFVFKDQVVKEPTSLAMALERFGNDTEALLAWAEGSDQAGARSLDYDYELRHPGHGDQSVHNPHKGGAAAGPGAFVPGKWEKQPEPTREQHRAETRAKFIAGREDRFNNLSPEEAAKLDTTMTELADMTYADVTSSTKYKNGPVTMYVDKDAAVPLTPELQARMDAVTADVQAKYPGEMTYSWTNIPEPDNAIGVSRLGSRAISFDSAKMEQYKDDKGGLEHTVWHETGHALPMKGMPDDGGFQILPEVEGIIDGYAAQVASKFPKEFSVGYIQAGPSGNLATMISRYATKDKAEMHAEIFALFHNPLAKNATFQQKVINEYAKAAGWKP